MQPLNIAFIGAGLMAHGHALSLRTLMHGILQDKKISLGAVYDTDAAKARTFANQHEVEKVVTGPEEIWEDPSLNVVYICTPTLYHRDYFLRAAASGKSIFVEKPLSSSMTEIDDMLRARDKHGITAQVGLVLRFEPVFRYLKDYLFRHQEELGKLLSFIFRSDQEWPITGSLHDSPWRGDPELAHAGCLFEHSIHDVDLVRFFFGEVSELNAYTAYRSGESRGGLEDYAAVNFRLENGAGGHLTSMYHHIKDRDVRRFEIFYENGVVIIDDYVVVSIGRPRYSSLKIEITGRKPVNISLEEMEDSFHREIGWPGSPEGAKYFAYQYQAFSFIDALLTGREAFPSLETGREAHRLIENAYQASRESRQAGAVLMAGRDG